MKSNKSWEVIFREAVKRHHELEKIVGFSLPKTDYSIFFPRPFLKKVIKSGVGSILWKQFIPDNKELSKNGLYDPIGDKEHFKTNQLIHRYRNRVLFLPTSICPIVCRYCFRKNEISSKDEIFKSDFEKTLAYLNSNTSINEIIFSGGDPFILSDDKLSYYLKAFSKISHIRFVRFHTRVPIVFPERITDKFLDTLSEFKKNFDLISVVTHVNHADEIDNDVQAVLKKISNNFFSLSQSVLLNEINDDTKILKELFLKISSLGVRPYYLHHPDKVQGGEHFYVSIERGRKIYHGLRKELSGYMIPQYILDLEGGRGKVPLSSCESFDNPKTFLSPL